MSPPDDARGTDIHDRMNRLPLKRLHVGLTAMCALGFSFDLMEMALGNLLSAVFSLPPYRAASGDLASLLASVYIGAIVGSPLFGWGADRYGRRRMLIAALAVLAGTSMAAAFCPDTGWLTVARLLSGMALGAYPPLMFAYLSDILPPARRGLLTLLAVALGAAGPPIGIFFVRALSADPWWGIEAWRWAFAIGAIGSGVVACLFWLLPESPRWLATRGRFEEAEAACARFEASTLVFGRRPDPAEIGAATRSAGASASELEPASFGPLAVLYFLSPWSTVAFPVLIGAVLVNKGFLLSDALLFVGVSTFGLMIGSALSAAFIDRIERRWLLGGAAAAMAALALVFALSHSSSWLIATSTLFTLVAALYVPALSMYGSEVFPTARRARLSSIAWAFNRAGAALGPLVLLPLLQHLGAFSMAAVIVAAAATTVVVLAFCPPGRAGRPVA